MAVAALVVGCAAASPAHAQAKAPQTVAGEIILYMQPGIAKADVQALAATVQPASFTPLMLKDTYVLELPAAKRTDQDTAAAAAILKADPRVKWAGASPLYHVLQSAGTAPKVEPNDPRYRSGEQWNLKLINMPQAWALEKGAAGVNVGWIDSGYDPAHEDAGGQFDPGSFDEADNDSDVTADGSGPEFDHGTHTSGIAIAKTDNNIGIAGIDWQNIKVVALKIQKKGNANLDTPAILNSYAYILANYKQLHIVAFNMSYGGTGLDPAEQDALQQLANAGVIPVASAGNSGMDGNPVIYPAAFPFVISVSALNQAGKLSYYSSFGKVEIGAPGGEQFADNDPGGILSLVNDPAKKYVFAQGTSDASPHVTGVLGLLMSVPGVTPAIAKAALLNTANHNGLGALPDPKYGFGILDAYAALAQVSVQALVTSPEGVNQRGESSDPNNVIPPPVETFKPLVSFHFNNVTCDNVTFTIDASIASLAKTFTLTQLIAGNLPQGITDFTITGACTGVPNPKYDVSFRLTLPSTGFFQHTVMVTGTDPNSGISRSDTRLFTITPHTIPSGLSMISIPYFESAADAPAPFTGTLRDVPQLLGTTPTLYRYQLPSELASEPGSTVGPYAKFNATDPKANVNASFHPLDIMPSLVSPPSGSNGSPLDTRPLGVGYFIDAPAAIPVITFGVPANSLNPTSSFRIPLHEGWNMIGDPYPFSVPFNSTEIETSGGSHIPVAQAADQNLILPHIYRLVSGDYQFATLPDGSLNAWEGHWIFVIPKDPANLNAATVLSLIVNPTPGTSATGRAAIRPSLITTGRAAGPGSWKLQLQAHVADKNDDNNYVGMSGAATDGIDRTKVPKPPKVDRTVSLAIVRPETPSTVYAQDLRSLGGNKQWNVSVTTDRPNANVTIEWPNARSLPKNYSLILTDQVTGTSLDVRNTSSYQFNSGPTAGTRSFSLVARPTAGVAGHPMFTNIVVNPGRSGGRAQNVYNIEYNLSTSANVSVSIMTPGGHAVAQIVTRAVTAGDNAMTWNGLDNAGRPVPAGSYVLQFQAATTDGQTTRVIRPLILTGR
jgi:hypothetical protein